MGQQRTNTDQITVFKAVVARLKFMMPDVFNESTCLISFYPLPPVIPPSDLFCTVSPGPGQFNASGEEESNAQAEDTAVKITVYSRLMTDMSGWETDLLLHQAQGLFAIKKRILAAFDDHDLLDDDGNPILRDLMYPIDAGQPDMADNGMGFFELRFGTNFTWDTA